MTIYALLPIILLASGQEANFLQNASFEGPGCKALNWDATITDGNHVAKFDQWAEGDHDQGPCTATFTIDIPKECLTELNIDSKYLTQTWPKDGNITTRVLKNKQQLGPPIYSLMKPEKIIWADQQNVRLSGYELCDDKLTVKITANIGNGLGSKLKQFINLKKSPLASKAASRALLLSEEKYIEGGVIGTIFGLGIGDAIEDRYKSIGWKFSVSEGIGGVLIIVGGSLFCCSQGNGCAIGTGIGLIVGGTVIVLGFKVWEIVDLWTVDFS